MFDFDPTKVHGVSAHRPRLSEALVDCLTSSFNDNVKIEFSVVPKWNMIGMTVEKNTHRRNLVFDIPILKSMTPQNLDEYMAHLFIDAIKDIDRHIEMGEETNG